MARKDDKLANTPCRTVPRCCKRTPTPARRRGAGAAHHDIGEVEHDPARIPPMSGETQMHHGRCPSGVRATGFAAPIELVASKAHSCPQSLSRSIQSALHWFTRPTTPAHGARRHVRELD